MAKFDIQGTKVSIRSVSLKKDVLKPVSLFLIEYSKNKKAPWRIRSEYHHVFKLLCEVKLVINNQLNPSMEDVVVGFPIVPPTFNVKPLLENDKQLIDYYYSDENWSHNDCLL